MEIFNKEVQMNKLKFKSCLSALLAVLAAGLLFTSYSKPVQNLRGTIKFYGNSPFEFAGFESEDGKKYTIEVEEKEDLTLQDLTAHSGELIEVSGKIKKKNKGVNSLPDGHIIIDSYSVTLPL